MIEHFHRITRGMADCQNDRVRFKIYGRVPFFLQGNPLHRAVVNQNIGELCVKPHFAAESQNLFAHRAHNAGKLVRADVGFGAVKNFFGRAVADKLRQHFALAVVFGAGVEFAVGKRTRAPFAELHIGLGVQTAGQKEIFDRLLPFFNLFAALDDKRTKPRAREHQRRKHAGGSKAHHDRAERRFPFVFGKHIFVNDRFAHFRVVGARKQAVFVARDGHIYRVNKANILFLSAVKGFFKNRKAFYVVFRDFQCLCREGGQFLFVAVQRYFQFVNSNHGVFSFTTASPAARPELHAQCKL